LRPSLGCCSRSASRAQDDIFKEIDILIGLDHPNVIFLKEYFEENNKARPPAPRRAARARRGRPRPRGAGRAPARVCARPAVQLWLASRHDAPMTC